MAGEFLDDMGLSRVWEKITDLNDWIPKNAGAHNSIYRGKNITYKVTDESLYSDIYDGSFNDIFVGDYFDVAVKYVTGTQSTGGQTVSTASAATRTRFRVMDIDRYLDRGNDSFGRHHIVVVPDYAVGTCLMDQHFSEANVPYANTEFQTLIRPALETSLTAAFGSHLLSKAYSLVTSLQGTTSGVLVSGGANGAAYSSCKVVLLSELEVYGCYAVTSLGNTRYRYETGIDYGQLAGFKFNSNLIKGKNSVGVLGTYWLRNSCAVDSTYTYYATVQSDGRPQAVNGASSCYIRPKILIG